MAEYTVRLADERGHLLEQVEQGGSENEVRDRFAQQGYLVYSVKARGLLAGGEAGLPRRRKIKSEQFLIFNQQFLTLIHAGLPIIQALELLMKRQRNPYFRSILQNVRDRVRGGELLSHAFDEQRVFPKVYTTTILAGEKSGNLEEVMGRYIAFQRLAVSFRKKLTASLGIRCCWWRAGGDDDLPHTWWCRSLRTCSQLDTSTAMTMIMFDRRAAARFRARDDLAGFSFLMEEPVPPNGPGQASVPLPIFG